MLMIHHKGKHKTNKCFDFSPSGHISIIYTCLSSNQRYIEIVAAKSLVLS